VGLWRLAREDVSNLCHGSFNLGALQLLPEVKGPQFQWFWRRRRQLFNEYSSLIARGISDGTLPSADAATTGDLVFGLVESVITARSSLRKRASTPEAIADGALRLCGVRAPRLRTVPALVGRLEAARPG
jgi:hypothetical protein